MKEVKEVHYYDESPTASGWVVFVALALVLIAGIVVAMWQPWSYAPEHTTTVIHDAPATTPAPQTTVINPPASTAPNTTIINTPPPESKSNDSQGASDQNSENSGENNSRTENENTSSGSNSDAPNGG